MARTTTTPGIRFGMSALIVSVSASLLLPILFVLVDAADRGVDQPGGDSGTPLLLGLLIAASALAILAVLVLTVAAFRRDARRGVLFATLAVVVIFLQAGVVAVLLTGAG